MEEKKNKELELERKLLRESTRLDLADTYKLDYEKSIKISMRQDEMYKKWRLLKGIREARERIDEHERENKESHHSKTR